MVVAALLNVSASFMNGGAGTGMVDFFHGFQVALMMTVMLNLTQFVWWRCKQSRRGTCLQVHIPTLWTLAATIMVNIQPMWILIIGSSKLCCGTNEQMGFTKEQNPSGYSYSPWAGDQPRPCSAPGGNVFWDVSYCGGKRLSTFPTVGSGWAVQIIFTWGGFVCMFIGVMMATQLHVKLRKQWRSARAGR
jgi:carbon starvation protein CstA